MIDVKMTRPISMSVRAAVEWSQPRWRASMYIHSRVQNNSTSHQVFERFSLAQLLLQIPGYQGVPPGMAWQEWGQVDQGATEHTRIPRGCM